MKNQAVPMLLSMLFLLLMDLVPSVPRPVFIVSGPFLETLELLERLENCAKRFDLMKTWLKQVVDSFKVGENFARFAMVHYNKE